MTQSAVTERLLQLEEAGKRLRERSVREVVAALAATLDAWRDPTSAWRRSLEAELPKETGFAPDMVRTGMSLALESWTSDAFLDLIDDELGGIEALEAIEGPTVSGYPTTALLLAGAIPSPTLLQILAPLVLRSPVAVKTASHDSVTADLVARSIENQDPQLGECVEVLGFPGSNANAINALLEAPCIVANGSDATIEAVAKRIFPGQRFIPYGHKVSVGALGPHAVTSPECQESAEALAQDVVLWDQLGCLSPVAVFVSSVDKRAPERFAEELASALAALEVRWPRCRVDVATGESIVRERSMAEMRRAQGGSVRVLADSGTRWTVVLEDDTELRAQPRHRFVRVHPVASESVLLDSLAPLSPHLSAVALAGFGPKSHEIARALADLGASRICRPGSLQAPPLRWRRDNRGVLTPLARFSEHSRESGES